MHAFWGCNPNGKLPPLGMSVAAGLPCEQWGAVHLHALWAWTWNRLYVAALMAMCGGDSVADDSLCHAHTPLPTPADVLQGL